MNERDLQDMRDAYPPDSPKNPDWAEAMADRADMDRKRAKEDGPAWFVGDMAWLVSLPGPESDPDLERLKEAGFEVYGWVPMESDE